MVKPETLSKSASVKEGMQPLMRNGTAPKRLVKNQADATMTNVERIERLIFFFLKNTRFTRMYKIPLVAIGIKKEGITLYSEQAIAVITGTTSVEPTMPKSAVTI